MKNSSQSILAIALSSLILLLPIEGGAADCQLVAKVKALEIRECGGNRLIGFPGKDGALKKPVQFDEIPTGLDSFWSDACACSLWQVSSIAGAHTHIVRFFRELDDGTLALIPGGEFGSEIGKISRVNQAAGFVVEVRDSDVSGKRKTLERYLFSGTAFSKIKGKSLTALDH